MMYTDSFVTTVQGKGFFKIPNDKQPTNKFLKKKDDDKTLAEKVLDKVFSEFKNEKHEKPSKNQDEK